MLITNERLKALLNSSPDVICSIDKEGRFIDISQASFELWGYNPEELSGKFYIEMVLEEDKAKTMNAAQAIMSGVNFTNFENNYRCKNGSVVPIVWSAKWDHSQEIMYCVARNATEKKEAEKKVVEAEKEKNESRLMFELFMKNSPLVAWITDKEGIMRYMNPTYLNTYGFTEKDLGKTIFDLFKVEESNDYFQNNLKVITTGIPIETIEPAHKADGSLQIIKVTKFPIEYSNTVMVAGWATDITHEIKLQEELKKCVERNNYVNLATSDAIFDWDVQTGITYRGDGFERIFGEQVSSSISYQNIHPDDVENTKTIANSALNNPQVNKYETEYRYSIDGINYKNLYVKAFILRDQGKAVRVIGAAQDVTRQKSLQKELEESNKYKDKLLSVIAHDLRNPLSGCVSLLELMTNDYDSFTREEMIESLNLVHQNSKNSLDLLLDLLLWAQNQLNKIHFQPEPVNFEREINNALEPFSQQLNEKLISIKQQYESSDKVFCDSNMFRTVIRNLVSNAIKFSPVASKIMIHTTRKQGELIFSITDQGIGFDQSLKDKILKGINGHSSFGTKGEKGTGLGLGIAKDFIEKNGGKLCIETEIGRGSTFSFSLPVYLAS